MDSETEQNEQLLNAWLRLSTALSNDRIVKNMPYKEALICNLLTRTTEDEPLTATDLCRKTKMLKSQMNRTLGDMEKKGLIRRERSDKDRRRVYVTLNPDQSDAFREEHQKNLNLVGAILDRYGRERADTLARDLNALTDAVDEVLS